MLSRNSCRQDILKEDYQKSSTDLTLLFFSHPVSLSGHYYRKLKWSGTSYQLLFMLPNMSRSFLFLVTSFSDQASFDIRKIIENLFKPFHDIVVIPFSTPP